MIFGSLVFNILPICRAIKVFPVPVQKKVKNMVFFPPFIHVIICHASCTLNSNLGFILNRLMSPQTICTLYRITVSIMYRLYQRRSRHCLKVERNLGRIIIDQYRSYQLWVRLWRELHMYNCVVIWKRTSCYRSPSLASAKGAQHPRPWSTSRTESWRIWTVGKWQAQCFWTCTIV